MVGQEQTHEVMGKPTKLRIRNTYNTLPPVLRSAMCAVHNQMSEKIFDKVDQTVTALANDRVSEAIEKILEHPETAIKQATQMLPEVVATPKRINDEELFQLFAIYCGDIKRCALAANVDEATVEAKALEGAWKEKIALLVDLRTSAKPGDSERGINRAVNFVQAHRWRNHLQRVMNRLMGMSDGELEEMLIAITVDKAGTVRKQLNTRAFADLSSALEKCHALSYQALNDTATERRERGDEQEEHKTAAELHLGITQAMEQVRAANRAKAEAEANGTLTVVKDTQVT